MSPVPVSYGDALAYDRDTTYLGDFPFYFSLAKNADRTLELGCGTGRITIPLAVAGVNITGLDNSKTMLEQAIKKGGSTKIHWVEADCLNFSFAHKFDLIILNFNGLHHFTTFQELQHLFKNVRTHLNAGGVFAFDVFNPLQYKWHPAEDGFEGDPKEFNRLSSPEKFRDGKEEFFNLYPNEIDSLCSLFEFKIQHKYGNFSRKAFELIDLHQIVVCQ